MLKIIQKQLDTHLLKISAVTAIIYCLLFNTPVFLYNFKHYDTSFIKGALELGKDFTLIYTFLFVMFFGLTIHRLTFITCTLALFASRAIASYNLFFHYIIPNQEGVRSFFNIDPSEITDSLSIRLLIWTIFSVAIAMYIIKHFKIENSSLFFSKLLSALCLLFVLNCIISPPYRVLKAYFPILYLNNTYLYFSGKSPIKSSKNHYRPSVYVRDHIRGHNA